MIKGAICMAAVWLFSVAAWGADLPGDIRAPEIRSGQVEQAREAVEGGQSPATTEELDRTEGQKVVSPPKSLTEIRDNLQILDVMEAQQAAWNRGDIDAFMEGYWKSDELRFASGNSVTKGWQATLERYKERYASREKMGTLKFSDLDIDVLSEDAAVVFGRYTLERKEDTPTGLFTLLFRKIDGDWVIVHDHTSSE